MKSRSRQAEVGYRPDGDDYPFAKNVDERGYLTVPVTAPATDLAKQWEGWGTALKPAHEPIVMARKPLVGSVAANVTRYGTGALNIDGTRIGTTDELSLHGRKATVNGWDPRLSGDQEAGQTEGQKIGRWPSNLLLSDPELFDVANPGVVGSGATNVGGSGAASGPTLTGESTSNSRGKFNGVEAIPFYGDSGGYSRFFIVPKSARADREPVLRGQLAESSHLPDEPAVRNSRCLTCGKVRMAAEASRCHCEQPKWVASSTRSNVHPTVKPTDLMRHLVRLVTPPGGTVLDCFLGSGSTAIACELEGFPWIGIEKEAEYVAIAEARLNGVQRGLGLDVPAPIQKRTIGEGTYPKGRAYAKSEMLGLKPEPEEIA